MELIIKINVDNDAFAESKFEVARCLSKVAGEILDTPGHGLVNSAGFIHDSNGNRVGQWDIID